MVPPLCRAKACMVLHSQREEQEILSVNDVPCVEWKKAEDLLKFEGLYIFGGLKKDNSINNKLYILALQNNYERRNKMSFRWKSEDEMDIKGKAPKGRYDHAMKKFKNTIMIFGGRKISRSSPFSKGIYILQLVSLTWIKLQQASGLPHQLYLGSSEFTSILVRNNKTQKGNGDVPQEFKMLIFGGIDENFHVSN